MLFKKGNIPWNKGKKGICKKNSGSFKKGSIPYLKGKKLWWKPKGMSGKIPCKKCHRLFHKIYGRNKNNKNQIIEFIKLK